MDPPTLPRPLTPLAPAICPVVYAGATGGTLDLFHLPKDMKPEDTVLLVVRYPLNPWAWLPKVEYSA